MITHQKPIARLTISNQELRAIGHVAAQWAYLENSLNFCIKVVLAQPLAAHLNRELPRAFERRTALARKAIAVVLADFPEQRIELIGILDDACSLRGRRDEIIHGEWGAHRDKHGRLGTSITVKDSIPTFTVKEIRLSAEQTEEIARKISLVSWRLMIFLQDLPRSAS